MKGYLRFQMINDDRGVVDSAIICGDFNPSTDVIAGMSYYVKSPRIHCRFVE